MGGNFPHRLRIEVLGPLRAWRDGTPLRLGPVKRQTVLAALLLRNGAVVSHEQLLDGVWGADPPASGTKVLASHVNPLRRTLDRTGTRHTESVIRSGKGWYRFVLDGVRLDLADLAELGDEALRTKASGDPAGAADQLDAALALFQGEPLANLSGPFALAERERLLERRRTLRLARLACLVDLGRYGDALDDLACLPDSDHYDESMLALRMRALYGCERQAEALHAYEDMRRRLSHELGVDPGEELRRVHEAVLRQDDGSLLGPAVRATVLSRQGPVRRSVNQLPGDTGQLVGREAELATLISPDTDDAVSVAAVDGAAGVGKTALAVRAAHRIRDRYPDGCLFVDLHAHSTERGRPAPERVLRRLLRSIGADGSEVSDDLDDLMAAWRAVTSSLRLLLVLDDAADAGQIRPLLPAGPGSRVIVTGRQRLAGLDADRRITLESLGTGEATSLLRQIVGRERTDHEPEAVGALVRLCAGLPLALRIAGTRLQTRPAWTLAYLVDRMAGDEGRLVELSAGDRSVEAAFRLSYDQLPLEQQRGFRTLGVVPTVEFDVRTPAAMLGRPAREVEQVLESLVDTSLLQQPRPGRYRLHDLVRVHARRLAEAVPAEAGTAREAALRLYLDAARVGSDWGAGGYPTGPGPSATSFADWREGAVWLDEAGGELVDVVGQAVAHGRADHACWIAEALTDHFVGRGRLHECQAALETALPHADAVADRRMAPALHNCLGYTLTHRARFPEAFRHLRTALHLSRERGERHEEGRALVGLGAMTGLGATGPDATRSDEGASWIVAGRELAERYDDHWLVAMASFALGFVRHAQGRDEEALACFRDAHARGRAIGRPRAMSRALTSNLDLHLYLDPSAARVLFHQVADLVQRTGDVLLHTLTLARLGTAEHNAGNLEAAAAVFRRALEQHGTPAPLDDPDRDRREMDLRCRLGRTYRAAGRLAEAREQFQTALAVPGAHRYPKEHAQAVEGLALGEDPVRSG
ncbi:AfsR/SARP family transcriptional regulator [Streptomyces sp. PAL114]|uniref:AfsR/SARP family transcriptional regulator n=1 Tax=Streptomyces sp. PAL114 TaxID=2970893 RepID=UPI0028FD4F02|nr:BTAD domain-containing putative transcriptional regulator [Streptomyces sp. PAL114]MDU0301148.1 BTAD domain-containing putative transcriptional regulator [Streptomyces sp. PAL114]